MHIKLTKRMLDRMTADERKLVGYHDKAYYCGVDAVEIPLARRSDKEIEGIKEALQRLRSLRMKFIKPLLADIDRWLEIQQFGTYGAARPKTLRQFADLLTEYIRTAPGHRVYEQDRDGGWNAFYANEIEYKPERRDYRSSLIHGASVRLEMLYEELGGLERTAMVVHNSDVDRKTVGQALADQGYVIETPDLRAEYLAAKARYDEVFDQVGRQFWGRGHGRVLGDRYARGRYPMMHDGVPGKVVVDVVDEDTERVVRQQGYGAVRTNFWASQNPKATVNLDSNDLGGNRIMQEQGLDEVEDQTPEVPLRTTVPVYHLGRHERFKLNVTNLEDYEFDRSLGEALVLPAITKRLVNVLVSQGQVSFSDIVAGKGSGVCVLLGGQPGIGKTLTAEVFAEATERPLLSIQAAQLGIDPASIEKNLRQVLRRSSRWNAVVLLDEADVYIHERGVDLDQNSIVASFLRVIEYHTATIFMTTNRMESVDDAILSRCLARIDYQMPDVGDQRMIWSILSELNGVALSGEAIDAIVATHDDLSGRDIKQLLKLAALWAERHDDPVGPATIDFVRQFLPTRSLTMSEEGR